MSYIVEGPPLTVPVFEGSFPEYLFNRWKALPKKKTLIINGHTGESLTAEDLLKKSIQVARGIKTLGLNPGDRVLFYGRTSINLLLGEYGVLLQGGVFAPIDPLLKLNEVRHMVNVVQPKFVFCETEHYRVIRKAAQVLNHQVLFIIVDDHADEDYTVDLREFLKDEEVNVEEFVPANTKDPQSDVIVIASSSGSTGLPKGVEITHLNLIVQILYWEYFFPEPIRFLQLTQFFWISAILTSIISSTSGMSRVFVKSFKEEEFLEVLDKYKPGWSLMTPADLTTLMKFKNLQDYDVSSFSKLIVGGTAVRQAHLDLVKQYWPYDIDIIQGYGATELSGLITMTGGKSHHKKLSAGSVVPGSKMKIEDPNTKKSLPMNEIGEVCILSPSIMKGYINNKSSTEESIDQDGYYHTGDLGYYDEDGDLYITGRIKEIFKYRAVHISPADMESVISLLEEVKEVGVVGIPHPEDVYQPLALVVLRTGFNITEEQIKKWVSDNMADTKKLAGGVRFVDKIPTTTTGKLKRSELQTLGQSLYQR